MGDSVFLSGFGAEAGGLSGVEDRFDADDEGVFSFMGQLSTAHGAKSDSDLHVVMRVQLLITKSVDRLRDQNLAGGPLETGWRRCSFGINKESKN